MSEEIQTQIEMPEAVEAVVEAVVEAAPAAVEAPAVEAPAVEAPAAGTLSVVRPIDYEFTGDDFRHLAAALELPMDQVSFSITHSADSATLTAAPKA